MKKNLKYCLAIIFIVLIAAAIIPKPINDLDELWNFNFARNIANGKLPYKEFNMVQTPLLSIIAGLVLKLFGTELLVMRFLACLLIMTIFISIYSIFKELKISNKYICLFLLGFYLIYMEYFRIDYNFAVLAIILFTIYFEIKGLDRLDFKKELLLGMFVGLSILIKQTTGLAFSLVYIFYRVLNVYEKQEWKNELKRVLFRGVGVLIPVICFVIYLLFNNIWYEFIDYTVLGIKTFSNRISYFNLIKGNYGIQIQFLSIIIPIFLIYLYIRTIVYKITTREDKILFIFFSYGVASLVVVYPISDSIHFLIGILPLRNSFSICALYENFKIDNE